ncbi:MAG: cytochrome b/b6 domain-containing protein [Nitrospirae bacterium]|nr:cytochrome b/b6 domain-containing protein [Nitrospirota bacterium]
MEIGTEKVKVWDPFVRIFHWALVACFAIAYLVGDDFLSIHVLAGYSVLVLVLFRLLWGFIGPEHARFTDFIYHPRSVLSYLRDLVRFSARRYLGHGPAGGTMIIALLTTLILTTLSGLALYGAGEFAGPLAGLMAGIGEKGVDALEDIHEFLAGLTLTLVAFHVAGVILSSFVHRENLIKAMFTGYKGGLKNETE